MDSERFAAQLGERWIVCAACHAAPPEFERAVAYAVYEGELRRMIHLLKYERVRSMAAGLGAKLAEAMATLPDLDGAVVAPVPLFPAKERQRGYNQASLLADAASRSLRARRLGLRLEVWPGAMARVRDTESHFALTRRMRRMNLRGAFTVNGADRIRGRNVVLVDDIYTTGATARECSRVLRKAGAARVWVATLARAQTEQAALWDGGG